MTEPVVLVDATGARIGTGSKLEVHQNGGVLHLGFSTFVFDLRARLLLQRRARSKYHFAGLWSNTCCGHPRPEEDVTAAATRRLREEFGFTTELRQLGTILYSATDDASGLTEREYLHVFRGEYEGRVAPEPAEIEDWRWTALGEVRRDLERAPHEYTPWFRIVLESVAL